MIWSKRAWAVYVVARGALRASVMIYPVDDFAGLPSENESESLDMVRERCLRLFG